MFLILQIALGIVLAVFVLMFLREIVLVVLSVAVPLIVVAVVGLTAILVWLSTQEYHEQMKLLLSGTILLAPAAVIVWFIFQFLTPQADPSMDHFHRQQDDDRSNFGSYHFYYHICIGLMMFGLIVAVSSESRDIPISRLVLNYALFLGIWGAIHLIIEVIARRVERRRVWRQRRRQELDAIATQKAASEGPP